MNAPRCTEYDYIAFLDGTTLDEPYAKKMELVTRPGPGSTAASSGLHQRAG